MDVDDSEEQSDINLTDTNEAAAISTEDQDVLDANNTDPQISILQLNQNPLSQIEVQDDISSSTVITNETPHQSTSSISNALSQESTSTLSDNMNSNICTSPCRKRRLNASVQEDDSQACPICFDDWTTSGEHRLCSLKCGHLFGYSCVKRWLDSELKKCCPTCKKKVHINEIRYIYARKVIAMDTTELTIIKRELQNANTEKNRIQLELSKSLYRVHTLTEEVESYKKQLNAVMYANKMQNKSDQSPGEVIQLYKEKTIELGRNSCCRVFDCKESWDTIGVSMKSTNALYCGFGVKRLSMSKLKPLVYIPLHSDTIRDIKFHESKPLLLSCSIDKKAKVLDVNLNSIVVTFDTQSPLWSCTWDMNNENILYLGQQHGSVFKYDMRKPTELMDTVSIAGDFSPVVSVQAIKSCSLFPLGGVVMCKLNSIWIFEYTAQGLLQYPLPFDGPFISMTFQKDSNHLFLTCRPNSRYPYARHFLCGLSREGDGIKCNIVHTFRGGNTQRMLTRTCLLSNKSDYAAAYIEDQRIVSLWNINTGNKVGSIPAHEAVLDLNSIKTSQADFLLSLTESKLRFFKFAS